MVTNIFGRNRSSVVEEMITDLIVKVDDQAVQLSESNKLLATMRAHTEAMETRLKYEFVKGLESAVELFTAEIAKIGKGATAQEVVNAVGKKTAEERFERNLKVVEANMNKAMARYLVNDLPLYRWSTNSKNPTLTPQGVAVYEAISKFTVDLAKVVGVKKETYTHNSKYARFFRNYGIDKYKRITVNYGDRSNRHTLCAAVIVNGHVKQYIDFLMTLLEEERKAAQ